jgi:hypothetical protein
MSKLRYSSGYDDPQDEPDDFPDVTDDFEPDHEPEDYEADNKDTSWMDYVEDVRVVKTYSCE